MTWILLGVLAGLVALVMGGELLVRGASGLALAANVSPLVIGLTVVALGTSSPELAVSVQSSYTGRSDLAVGNVVGSNICNILLILGVSALPAGLLVQSRLFRLDIPVMIAAAAALWAIAGNGAITRLEGIVLTAAMVVYLWWTVTEGRRETKRVQQELLEAVPTPPPAGGWALPINVLLVLIGLVALVMGSDWLVDACVELAHRWGISELVIGLTVVAIGTSLPELVTSLMASLRGQRDLAVGNVVGSNILNIFCVLGLSAIVAPNGIPVDAVSLRFDIPLMVAISLACLPIFYAGGRISRGEGLALVVYYGAYVTWLVRCAQTSQASTWQTTLVFAGALLVIVVLSQLRTRPIVSD